jgi:hypothetical protein
MCEVEYILLSLMVDVVLLMVCGKFLCGATLICGVTDFLLCAVLKFFDV